MEEKQSLKIVVLKYIEFTISESGIDPSLVFRSKSGAIKIDEHGNITGTLAGKNIRLSSKKDDFTSAGLQVGNIGVHLTSRTTGQVSYTASVGVGKLASVQVNGIIDTHAWLKACDLSPCVLVNKTQARHAAIEEILRKHLPEAMD
ncbi:hypothetical protein [Vibrio sp. SCSIO 43136]|uniref:hypothetical protein n=1 Tax=Vibrio sp. SCSIO 43136 TaxID=2819101 RepID=UPI002076260E|nr:hypothetical protein [Vibrio sp. SCSIO 43136]USD67283.1 hypothetical protein J4N39_21875 [Vibrio sp. SCSIO 43136]